MCRFFMFLLVFILCMGQCSCALVEHVKEHRAVKLSESMWVEVEDRGVWVRYKVTRPRRDTRQHLCRPLYAQGGDDWINCMGVGYK